MKNVQGKRWFVCTHRVLDSPLWVEAETASKARWRVVKAAWGAGYYETKFGDVKVEVDRSGLTPLASEVLHV